MAKVDVQPTDLVYMTHDVTGDHPPARTTVEAFEEVWKAKKWSLCDSEGNKVRSTAAALVEGAETETAAPAGQGA